MDTSSGIIPYITVTFTLNDLNVFVIMWSFGLLVGLSRHCKGVTLGSGCDNISHYFHNFDNANNQWIDGENKQQIDPDWKELLVAV